MKRFAQLCFVLLCLLQLAAAAFGQTTQITASNIAFFGGTSVTGTFCLTPTDQSGNPITITTPTGQQLSPQTPLCFPITRGVLSNLAIVPDTSLTQPVNACYKLVINNFFGTPVATFPCIQPQGATWSFDAYVPSSVASIPALTLPQFQLNGVNNPAQGYLDLVCPSCTVSGGHVTITSSGGAGHVGTPTISAGTGSGTSPTLGLASAASDSIGYITLTTGSSPAVSSAVATVTFGTTWTAAPQCFAWPASAATQALVGAAGAQVLAANTTTGQFVLTQGSTALAASTVYEWGYSCGSNGGGGVSGGATAPATSNLYKGNGSLNGIVAATPGTDFFSPLTAPGYGYVPVSSGAGTTFGLQAPVLQFGANNTQFVQAPFSPNLFAGLAPNNINKTLDVEGFSNSGTYSGVGATPVAWASGPDYGFCQVVSNSGTDWIAVQHPGSGTTAPGTNMSFWLPFPNFQAASKLDCAWYMGQAYKRVNHASIALQLGAATYTTGGLVDLVDGNSFDDEFSEGIIGTGVGGSIVQYNGSAAVPVISRPTGAGNFASTILTNFTIDGGGTASADLEEDMLGPSLISYLSVGHIAPGTTNHAIQIAHSGGAGFQVALDHINIGIFPDANQPNCAVVTPTLTAGVVTAWSVGTAGTCYHAASSTNVYHVQYRTTNGAAADGGCTTYPTGQTVNLSGTGVASITGGTGGTGCGTSGFVQVYSSTPVAYGLIVNNSDSHLSDITSYVGDAACVQLNAGNVTADHLHCSVTPEGVQTNVSGALIGTEIDDVFDKGFTFNQPFTTTQMSVVGTNGYVGCGGTTRLNVGSTMYYFASASTNVSIGASASLFDGGGAISACNAGWNELIGQSGPIHTPADFFANAPSGLSITGNDKSLTLTTTIGDYMPQLAVRNLTLSVKTVAGLPAASSVSPGTTRVVSDSNSFTPGTCTGGGSDFMLAVSDGVSTWTCH